ncbi:hypothetical protein HZP25_15685 [Elizabethkingia anophelis]|nr:hypothetical protein [Elizabethkingia anophelis]
MERNHIQVLMGLAFVPTFIFLTSCRSSDSDQTLSTSVPASVRINLTGTDYAELKTGVQTSAANKENVSVSNAVRNNSILLTPSSVITTNLIPLSSTLKPSAKLLSGIPAIAAVSGNSLTTGTKYRVIAYLSSNGSYQSYQDYTIGQTGQPLTLTSGTAYNIIAYSYGGTTLPAISAAEQDNLNTATLNYDNTNRDFMYQNINYTPTTISNVLNFTLRHKTTQIIPVLSSNEKISSISNAVLQPHFSNAIIPLSSGNITGRTTGINAAVVFPGQFPGATQTANPVFINSDTGGLSTGSFTADVTIDGVSKTISVPNAFTVTPETSSILNVSLSYCGAYIAPGVWKDFMCHNLGADTSANPFIPSAAIHGAKYQWGAQTGEVGRYVSQADDQANSGNITGWKGTGLPKGTWSDTSKTLQDPCPAGYRVPTAAEWQGVTQNNPIVRIGTTPWTANPTNYGNMIKAGNGLALPIPGARYYTSNTGYLQSRGQAGIYFSSSFSGSRPNTLRTSETLFDTSTTEPTFGLPIRCIKE